MAHTSAGPPTDKFDWREEFAYTAGVQAFVYGFPYIYGEFVLHPG